MNERRRVTIATYRKEARALAAYFDTIGSRTSDIERAMALTQREEPYTVEVGCGNGRDAAEILRHTQNYLGTDVAPEMVALAREKVPRGRFEVADMTSWEIPQGTDLVLSFASLLHLSADEVANFFIRAHPQLSARGIIYVSAKFGPYRSFMKRDRFGEREFFLYSAKKLQELSRGMFREVYRNYQTIGKTRWVTVAFEKM